MATIHSVSALTTGGFDHLDRQFIGLIGHIFPWANAFVGQGQSQSEAPVENPRCYNYEAQCTDHASVYGVSRAGV